jgi:hypothetical protein
MTSTAVRNHVYMFRDRFIDPMLAGVKDQTIRSRRRREPVPGDRLSLRCWKGRPYYSRQVEVLSAICLSVTYVNINVPSIEHTRLKGFRRSATIFVGIRLLPPKEAEAFARRDGFSNLADMAAYYIERKVYHFEGVVIRWVPVTNPYVRPLP